ncbi:MAG: carboxylesterase family protein [Rhizomicrobium sp.]
MALPAFAAPTVVVEQGALSGTGGDGIDAYKGIPYAAPPVGPLRWRAPRPAPHWPGTRDATAFGPICPQHPTEALLVRANLPQSEDCLTLNVWTPSQRSGKIPVMVWIPGGGFAQGRVLGPAFRRRSAGAAQRRAGEHHTIASAASASSPIRDSKRAISACSTRSRRSNGSSATSPHSAAIPATSRCSANRPAASASMR